MRRAIVHIGMPRTGSTTLQYLFCESRARLQRAGILYPDLTPRAMQHAPHVNHQHFGETLDVRRPRHERAELFERLSDHLRTHDHDTVLLSYEDFVHQQRRFRVPEQLQAFFASRGYAMEVVLIVKPQSEYWNSSYTLLAQMIRECRDFARFFREYEMSGRFAYAALIEPWRRACDGRIRAVPLRDRRSAASLIERFLTELGLNTRVMPLLESGAAERVENRSLGPLAIEVSRRLCALRFQRRIPVRPRDAMRFVERLIHENGLDTGKLNGMDDAKRMAVDERYRATDDSFAQTVWGVPWDRIVLAEPATRPNELAAGPIDPATERTVQDLMRQTALEYRAPLRGAPYDGWINRFVDYVEMVEGRLHLSRWRVV